MQGPLLYYNLMFIASAVLSCVYVYKWNKHFSVYFSLIFTLIPTYNLGYVFLAESNSVAEAIISVKITYLGGCFLILFITLYIFDMCKIKLDKWIKLSMFISSILIYASVLSIGKSNLFYVSVTPTIKNGIVVLEKEYGPVHSIFYILMFVYFAMSFGAIIYSFIKKHHISRRIIWLLFFPEIVAFISFFGGRMITKDFDLVPAAYVFAQIMYLIIAHIICLYDVTDTAVDSLMEDGDASFISFDYKLNYLGSTENAVDVFSELDSLTVDKPLSLSPELYDLFFPWIKAFSEDSKKNKNYYKLDDLVYLVDINYLYNAGVKTGFQLIITDDTKNQKYIELLDNYKTDLEHEVDKKTKDIINMHNNLIKSMAVLVESRDNSTGGHIVRTSDVVEILLDEIVKDKEFSKENHITKEFVDNLIKAAPLHDIGKIAVDDAILRKPGRFTDDEFEIMKTHAPEGAKVLHSILEDTEDESFKLLAENVAKYHHERMDGSGYPMGLIGDEIPMEARIMAIADVYDALVSKRVYKESMPFDKADKIMMESMGKHFDKKLKKFYVAARPKMEAYYRDKA
ncbi:MAG: HD domain-containing protein [Lachnospiraceae bacterium]|nr:HD domain-containing protein [Lachnospiraceae bacterium]